MSKPTPAEKKDAPAVADKAPETTPEIAPEKVYVRAVNGNMLNLFTNVWLTKEPKKVQLDDFVRGQVEAGKLEIVPA